MDGNRLLRLLASGQGAFYVAMGLWPLVNLASFEAVTGPKTDDWLVKTVGTVIIVIGAVLLVAAARRSFPLEVVLLAAGSALALAAVDVVFVLQRIISPVYLLDALVEVPLAFAWLGAYAYARGGAHARRRRRAYRA